MELRYWKVASGHGSVYVCASDAVSAFDAADAAGLTALPRVAVAVTEEEAMHHGITPEPAKEKP